MDNLQHHIDHRKKEKRIGLALGSGSARGWSHIGVIQCLLDAGIPIHLVCGSSMGAVVGGAYAAGILDALEDFAREFSWIDFLKFMDVSLSRRGLLEGDNITNFFREIISDKMIENLPLPYGAVAVDLLSGEEICFRKGPLLDAMRASFSLPGLFTPFERGQQWLIDGGLVNPVPVSLCRAMEADLVIAVNLNDDILGKNFSRKNSRINNGLHDKLFDVLHSDFLRNNLSFIKRFERPDEKTEKTPNMIEVMANAIYIMQDRITRQRLLEDRPDILISPRLSAIGLLEFHKAREAIEAGWESTNSLIPSILEQLGQIG
ncbi:MAG: patatin-like phospholipase family protein [Syntrophales bacterium]|jgi:NTE family protein|nr:patatin-like phospholipase family protein [Syntrophales bacterium]